MAVRIFEEVMNITSVGGKPEFFATINGAKHRASKFAWPDDCRSAANETPKAAVIKLQRVKFIIVLPSMAGLLVATGGRIFSVADNPQTAMPLWPLTGDGSRRRGFAGLSSAAAHVAARCAKTPLESG
jgi:hypothetical protein